MESSPPGLDFYDANKIKRIPKTTELTNKIENPLKRATTPGETQ
jgi:hypothetical protein